mmetsp:Transcript_12062/g.21923  ORF Transcript_12062/g.21923 Transcript_12062/m.21923 type:complete len:679 (+) Transcript_12062:1014-3050(+)
MTGSTLDEIDDPDSGFFDDLEAPSEYGYNCSFRGDSTLVPSSAAVSSPFTSIDVKTSSHDSTSPPNHQLSLDCTHTKMMHLAQMAANTPSDHMKVVCSVPAQVDGGANANIFTSHDDFLWFRPHRTLVTLANRSQDWSDGYGCVLAQLTEDSPIIPLYLCYLLPGNEWATISPLAIRIYNGALRATVHSLHSFEIVDANGNCIVIPTRHQERQKMHLDFIIVDIIQLNSTVTTQGSCSLLPPRNAAVVARSQTVRHNKDPSPCSPSIANNMDNMVNTASSVKSTHSPSSSDTDDSTAPAALPSPLDVKDIKASVHDTSEELARQIESRNKRRAQTILYHQRMAHVPYTTLQEMARRQLLRGLPRQLLIPEEPCVICIQAKGRAVPHGHTVSTDNLRASQRFHMDFSFVNVKSYHGFTSFLSIVCAKTRKLFFIATRSKRPPLEVCHFLYMNLTHVGRQPNEICVDCGGELAGSSKFVEFWCNLGVVVNDTGGYASFLNGKVERHNQTIMAGVRALLINKNSLSTDWCEALSFYNQVYDMTLHRGIDDTPYHAWYDITPSIENLHVWGATVFPIVPNCKKLDHRVGAGEFLGFNATSRLVQYHDATTKTTKILSSTYFDEYNVRDSNGDLSPGAKQLHGQLQDLSTPPPTLALSNSPLMDCPIHNIQVLLPSGTEPLGL